MPALGLSFSFVAPVPVHSPGRAFGRRERPGAVAVHDLTTSAILIHAATMPLGPCV